MTTALEVKKEILAAQVSLKRSRNNEERLERELGKFFTNLKKEVLAALDEYWSDYQMLKGHIDLICAPVHISHKDYYEILRKYKLREYKLGQAEAKRLYKLSIKKDKHASKSTIPVKGYIKRDNDLFATHKGAEEVMLNKTFVASDNTLNRVDGQINQIITDGYRSGKGINDVADQLTRRFDQLADWESRRIARTEIHGAHNQAVYDQYGEMGVEYTMWSSVDDGRTRGSKPSDTADHLVLNGEIIRVGDRYSNGLMFPGDTSGPIEEWINCRCSNAPFVMPWGKMAPPGMEQFRVEDLVDIEAKPKDFDELINNATEEGLSHLPNNNVPQQLNGVNDYVMKPITPDVLNSFDVKDITFGKEQHPLIITRELVQKYPKEFLLSEWYNFEEYAGKITAHYESYYNELFLNKLKTPIPGNILEGTKSIYDSFKYGCGNNFGKLNAYYRDKMVYREQLQKLGESIVDINEICERFDKIRINLLEGMKESIPLTEDTMLYRATSTNHEIPITEGEIGTFEGFTSTSFEQETPRLFYEKNAKKYNVFYKILAPKGTRGMALGSKDKLTNTSGQNEWLLPETQYKVKHVFQDGNNYVITVELINQII